MSRGRAPLVLLEGRRLFVVRNRINTVAVLRLDRDGDIARWRDALHLPNARFTTPPTPGTTYDVTRVERG